MKNFSGHEYELYVRILKDYVDIICILNKNTNENVGFFL